MLAFIQQFQVIERERSYAVRQGLPDLQLLSSPRQQLRTIETAQMKCLANLLDGLSRVKETGETLLDRTMVMQGSNLGHAGKHDNRNLPILLAGGGFKHGAHLAFSRKNNYPLANLYVSMLQRLGIETDKFASATGTMRGLAMRS